MQVSLGGAAKAGWSEKNIKAMNVMEFFIALYRKANADNTTMYPITKIPRPVKEARHAPEADPAVQERHQDPNRCRRAESQYPRKFAFQEKDFGREILQGLKHEKKIPFRPDSRRSGSEGIGLGSQFPREDCGQPSQHSQRRVPADHVAQAGNWGRKAWSAAVSRPSAMARSTLGGTLIPNCCTSNR